MKNNKQLLPKLRFPEFLDKKTWKETVLSEVLFEHKQKSTGNEEVFSVSVHKGIINQVEHLGRSFAASNTENYKRVIPGDIIFTKSPTGSFPYGIIKQSKVSKPVLVSPLYGVFSPLTIDLGFLLDAIFESPERTNNYLTSLVQKGAKNTINIHNDIFLSKSLILPNDEIEQQKIASCLSSLDDLIAAHNQKLELLKQHKKGLMQNLFPQKGEKVPKLRFKEFENDGEWVEKKLGVIAEKVIEKNKDLTVDNVFTNSATQGLIDQREYFDKDIANKKSLENYYIVKQGDYVYNPRISVQAPVGPTSKNNSKKIGVISPLYTVFRFYEKSNDFYQYYFHTSHWISSIRKIANTGARFDRISIKDDEFMKVLVLCPDVDEQQKIASCLSSLDELINKQTEKIEQLKEHKKGLMQGLFPVIEN